MKGSQELGCHARDAPQENTVAPSLGECNLLLDDLPLEGDLCYHR